MKKRIKFNICKKNSVFLLVIFIIFGLFFISAEAIQKDLHVNIQTTNAAGDIITGTYNFTSNISTDSTCTNIIYSNRTELATDTRGVVSFYLEDVNLNFSEQYWLCYYRDHALQSISQIARTPYSFSAENISASGILNDSNMELTGKNITASTGFFSWLGDIANRVTKLFVVDIDFTGQINGSGWINTTANVSADYYFGDGSTLSGVEGFFNSSGWNRSGTDVFLANTGDSVGIGNLTPAYKLQVEGNVSLNKTLYVNTNGRVGIGVASPLEVLEVDGNILLENSQFIKMRNTAGVAQLVLGMSGGTDYLNVGGVGVTDVIFGVGTKGEAVRIKDTTGYMGIGTSNPSHTLNVVGHTNLSGNLYAGNSTLFVNASSGNVGIGTASPSGKLNVYLDDASPASDTLIFNVNANGVAGFQVERQDGVTSPYMEYIFNNGNVGIGTTAPTQLLHVEGNTNVTKNMSIGKALVFTDNGGNMVFRI